MYKKFIQWLWYRERGKVIKVRGWNLFIVDYPGSRFTESIDYSYAGNWKYLFYHRWR